MFTFDIIQLFFFLLLCLGIFLLINRIIIKAEKNKTKDLAKKLTIAVKAGKIGVWLLDLKKNVAYNVEGDVLEKESQSLEELKDYFYSQHDFSLFSNAITQITNKEVETSSVRIRYKSYLTGEFEYIEKEMIGLKNKNGEIEKIIGTHRNVTKEILLNQELQQAKEKAEQSDRLKSLFLANMSHEIRTPLNSIVGFSQLLVEEELDKEQREKYGIMIKSNNELLLKVINDVLDMSKIEAGYLEIHEEEFDLVDFVNEVEVFAQNFNHKSALEVIVKNPLKTCTVYTDKQRLKQICGNYITNAIKYTSEGKVVFRYSIENKGLKIEVKDTGIGIAKKNYEKIFSQFEKLDNFAVGVGLGLSICKAIIETMGGEVGFKSKKNKGSTFWLFIPNIVRKEK